jgi:hypothetical protein
MGHENGGDYVFFAQKVCISEERILICIVDFWAKKIGSREELIKR